MNGIPLIPTPKKLILKSTLLEIHENNKIQIITYNQIKSKSINKESKLLKITTNCDTILEFNSIHVLDFVSITLSYLCKPDLKIIDSDILNIKRIIGNIIDDKQILKTYQTLQVFNKKFITNFEIENKISNLIELMLEMPVFIDVFVDMNLTINQFFNFLIESKFVDIKNKPNCLDRFLMKYLNIQDMNYASRINGYSQMTLNDFEIKESKIVSKELNFKPIYEEISDNEEYFVDFEFPKFENNLNLECNPPLKIENEEPILNVDKRYFRIVIEMCRIAYRNPDVENEIKKFEDDMIKFITKHYGNDSLKYFENIMPTKFIKNKQ